MISDSDSTLPGAEDDAVAALLRELPEEEGHRVSERAAVMIAAGALGVVAIGYLVLAIGYRYGTFAQPGPALFPTIIGVGFVVSAVGLFAEAMRTPRDRRIVWPYASGAARLGVVVVAGVVYLIAAPLLGQFVAGALVCIALLWSMRLRRWWLVLILSATFSASVVYLFGTLLGVPLPRGPFGF